MREGWERKTVGDLFNVGSSKRVLKSQWKTEGVPFYRGREITRLGAQGFVENDLFISEKHFAELSKKYGVPTKGDIMMTAIGTIGNTHVVRESDRFYFKDASVLWLERAVELDSDYVNYWIKSPWFYEQLDVGNGATVDTLTISKVRSLEIDLPPLAEQQRIVGILDEAFAGLATAKANAEKNLKNARALFESHLQSVFSQRGEGWVDTKLESHVDLVAGFAFKSSQYTDAEDGIRLVRGDNIVQGEFRWEGVKRWPKESAEEYSKFAFAENDVVLAMDRPWVAAGLKVAFVTKEDLPLLQVQRTARLRAKETLDWRFLFHLIRSTTYIQYLLEGQTGLGVPHISGKQILSFEFTLPPVGEQKSIVENLDNLHEETRRLTAIYTRKLAALEELKKALLHQAFSGEL